MTRYPLVAALVGSCLLGLGVGTASGVQLAVDETRADLDRIVASATDGTYTGNVGGKPFTLTVAGNKITGFKVQNLDCPSFTIDEASISTSCSIASNESFQCPGPRRRCGTGVPAQSDSQSMWISGSFGGDSVSGLFDADFARSGFLCCRLDDIAFSATRNGASVPAAPSNLAATATSDDRIVLTWQDNANDETEYRGEMRGGVFASFTDIGGVAANVTAAAVSGLDPATPYDFRVRARNASGYSAYSNVASAATFGGPTGPCVIDSTTLCLSAGRFQVRGTYRTSQPASGQAHVEALTPDTGYLWFFNSNNVEAVVKVINACGFNDRFWVFAGGLTDVEVIVTVTDTQTGAVKTYTNLLGTKFAPIQDTNAFATCP